MMTYSAADDSPGVYKDEDPTTPMGGKLNINLSLLAVEVRKKRGKRSLREVIAEIGDISAATLHRVEQGKQPSNITYFVICEWLGVAPTRFILKGGINIHSIESALSPVMNTMDVMQVFLETDPTLEGTTAEVLAKALRIVYEAGVHSKDAKFLAAAQQEVAALIRRLGLLRNAANKQWLIDQLLRAILGEVPYVQLINDLEEWEVGTEPPAALPAPPPDD